ncbi:hypothetical protein TWF730_003341 [Orbilia blumenaviensis]|uniref:Uncharacterized protein n=1 Tax=Orbilia blumenaviensis TaxID=1796055 RepID=A0AAV9U5A2_9PEZI
MRQSHRFSYQSPLSNSNNILIIILLFNFFVNPTISSPLIRRTPPYHQRRNPPLERTQLLLSTTPILSPLCRLGVYHDKNGLGQFIATSRSWEGFPFGSSYSDENRTALINSKEDTFAQCSSVRAEFGESVAKAGIRYARVMGYCACTFWFEPDCTGDFDYIGHERQLTIDAYQLDLRNNNASAASPREFNSFRCTKNTGSRAWSLCEIRFSNGGYNQADKVKDTPTITRRFVDSGLKTVEESSPDMINRFSGRGFCIKVSDELKGVDGIAMREWRISQCTCSFWTNDTCRGNPYIVDGIRGVVERKDIKTFAEQKIKSFRCDAPYGPSWV